MIWRCVALLWLTACYMPAPATAVRVVRVHDTFAFLCSGVVLQSGKVLTARHCLRSGLAVEGRPVRDVLYPWSVETDAVVLIVPGIGAAGQPERGVALGADVLIAGFGCSAGLRLEARTGSVVAHDGNEIVLNIRACPGDSGAPAYSAGRLIGIIRARTLPGDLAVVQLLSPP